MFNCFLCMSECSVFTETSLSFVNATCVDSSLKATPELTAVISEIIMYVLIVILQLWLVVVLVYCYKKVSDEHEAREARKTLKGGAEWVTCFLWAELK